MTREVDILEAIRLGKVRLPPLEVQLASAGSVVTPLGRAARADAFIDVRWGEEVFTFVAEIKAEATPKAFRAAIYQIRCLAEGAGRRPLIITPYLAPERLEELERSGMSGIDLCGNGVVIIPGEVLVVRTGNANQFPAARNIRQVYRGASSLVARVFLLRPFYDSVQEVKEEIASRGGRVSLSTVSKVLKALDDDLVIRREQRASSLLQADELLQRLASSYSPPPATARKNYRWSTPQAATSNLNCGGELILTGAASVERYSVMPREQTIQCYCPSIESIERRLEGQIEESSRFPDLELIQTRDPAVYFDARISGGAIPSASPLQCWLELQAGDKRQQDAAKTVRNRILSDLQEAGWSPP